MFAIDGRRHLMAAARVGDLLNLVTPAGVEEIEVLRVDYPAPGKPAAP